MVSFMQHIGAPLVCHPACSLILFFTFLFIVSGEVAGKKFWLWFVLLGQAAEIQAKDIYSLYRCRIFLFRNETFWVACLLFSLAPKDYN